MQGVLLLRRAKTATAFAMLTALTVAALADGCPCADPSLCNPITHEPEREVFVFSSPGTPNEIRPPRSSQSDWRSFDWSILTTVALVGPMEPQMMCYAHQRGVRLIFGWGAGAFCPGWLADSMNATAAQRRACIATYEDRLNKSLVEMWVTESVRYLRSIHVDGVNFDAEFSTPKGSAAREGEVYGYEQLTQALHAAIPGSKTSVTTNSLHLGLAPNDPDYRRLAGSVDYLVPMEYDSGASLYGGHSTPAGYAGGFYTSCAQMALSLVKFGVDNFRRAGVPAQKLVLVFPFYGYVFNCADNVTTYMHGPNRGCTIGGNGGPVQPSSHWAMPYDPTIMSTFDTCIPPAWWRNSNNSSTAGPSIQECSIVELATHAVDGLQWDEASSTPWFRYIAHHEQVPCGGTQWPDNCTGMDGITTACPADQWCRNWIPAQIREVWYDSGRSTSLKCEAAATAGVRGVGGWAIDSLDWNNVSQASEFSRPFKSYLNGSWHPDASRSLRASLPERSMNWKFCSGGTIFGSPTIRGSSVFFGSADNSVYKISLAAGEADWKVALGDTVVGSVAVSRDGSKVYVGSTDTFLHCLDGATGKQLWVANTGWAAPGALNDSSNAVWSTPVLSVDELTVYFGAYTGKVYCLDATTGAQHWNFSATWAIHGGLTLSSSPTRGDIGSHPTAFFGSIDYSVYAVRVGALLWKFATGDMVLGVPSLDAYSGIIFVGSSDRNLYALNATTGAQLWNFSTSGGIEGSATVDGDRVFFGTNAGSLHCLSKTTGTELWTYSTNAGIEGKPAVHKELVYVGSRDGFLRALGTEDGSLRWSLDGRGAIYGGPTIADELNTVVAAAEDCVFATGA